MPPFVDALRALDWPTATALFFVENLLIVLLAVGVGGVFVRVWGDRRVTPAVTGFQREELVLTGVTLVLNTAITVVGFGLWKHGWISFRAGTWWEVLLDLGLLLLVMDVLMYVLHRVAHLPYVFELLHANHHRYEAPRPLTLFVLHPLEALGFGSLWLVVLLFYQATWVGMSAYLVLNVAFGAIGHLGVEPFPRGWVKVPGLKHVTTSTFHAGHHLRGHTNFGFYTAIWDRLFGTLDPTYERDFGV